jgi:hypothetical protein
MPKGVLVVETAPSSPDRDAEFNDFYNNTHLAEILRVPEFKSARRFRRIGEGEYPYLAIYEVEADDLNKVLPAMAEYGQRHGVTESDAVDKNMHAVLYEQIYELAGQQAASTEMARGVSMVVTAPASPERDADFNKFYNDTHLVEVVRVPGWKSARRYHRTDGARPPYLAIYELQAKDDLTAAQAELGAAIQRGEINMDTDVLDRSVGGGGLYEQIYEVAKPT